jgi:hypothetical protein
MNTQEIIKFIESNSTLTCDDNSESELTFSTRANGNVGDGEYSSIDKAETRKIALEAIAKFGNIKGRIETVDEWVMLYIESK